MPTAGAYYDMSTDAESSPTSCAKLLLFTRLPVRIRHEQMCQVCLQGLGPFTVVKSKCITRTKAWLEHHSPCRTGFGRQQKEDSMVDWNSQCDRDGSWCPYTVTDLMLSGNSINKFYFLLYSVFHYLFLLII